MNRFGLIADTHDNIEAIRRALEVFQSCKVNKILHLGDMCEAETAWEFTELPTAYVLGNNELEVVRLRRTLEAIGIDYLGEEAEMQINGKSICLYHGSRDSTTQRLIRSQQYDYLLKGHSHAIEDYRVGRTRVINPGAIYRARPRSVAIFEPEKDLVEFYEVD
jgi:hypothetical protein